MTSFSGGIKPGIRRAYAYQAAAGRVDNGGNDRTKASFVIPIAVANTQGPMASTGTTATGASSITSFHSQGARRERAGGSNEASQEPNILLPPQFRTCAGND